MAAMGAGLQVIDSPLLTQQIDAQRLSIKHLKNENNKLKVRHAGGGGCFSAVSITRLMDTIQKWLLCIIAMTLESKKGFMGFYKAFVRYVRPLEE